MSWDVFIFASRDVSPPVEQMPDDWRGELLGSVEEVRGIISELLPGVDWSDPSWGLYDGSGYSYEFSIASGPTSGGFAIHVRGGGDAIAPLLRIAERRGWFLLDSSQGEWIHHCTEPGRGWACFQAYRDRMLADYAGGE